MMERLFNCVVCRRDIIDFPNRNGRERHIDPICRLCEREYGERVPHAGAFMDRRIAFRLSAIANALHNQAGLMEWESRYGRA